MESLYCSIPGLTGITSVSTSSSHGNSSAMSTINCGGISLDIGDETSIDLGYVTNHNTLLTGYIKEISRKMEDGTFDITMYDKMVRATEYFIVSTNPDVPFTRENILMEDLIGDVLGLSGITNYASDSTYFTVGVNGSKIEVNFVSSYDYCKQLADLMVWTLWMDNSGQVHFENRKPYPMTGKSEESGQTDTASFTINSNILSAVYGKSDKNLRNRVMVFCEGNKYATASASSPYLPSGFYKTVAYTNTSLPMPESIAQTIANYNLSSLNKLDQKLSLSIVANPDILCRTVAHIEVPELSIDSDWYIYSLESKWDSSGYTQTMELRQ